MEKELLEGLQKATKKGEEFVDYDIRNHKKG